MKASDLTVSETERQIAASTLIQTETTNAVNAELVESADASARQLGKAGQSAPASRASSFHDGNGGVFKNHASPSRKSGGTLFVEKAAPVLAAKQARASDAGASGKDGSSAALPAGQRVKMALKANAVKGVLQDSELEGTDDLYYKARGAKRLLGKAGKRVSGKKPPEKLSVSQRKYAKKKAPKEVQRDLQSKRNQAQAIQKASEAKAAGSAGAASAAAGNAAASGGGGFFAAGIGSVLLPIIGGVLVFLLFVMMLSSILGGNSANNSGSLSDNEWAVVTFLQEKGVDNTHIAAILGNMKQESGVDPGCFQSGGPGRGLLQWEAGSDRFASLCALASESGTTWQDVYVQLDYFWREAPSQFNTYSSMYHVYSTGAVAGLGRRMTFDEWLDVEDVAWATESFERVYTRASLPNMPNRISYAQEYLQMLETSGNLVNAAKAIAADDTHGYSRSSRQMNPDVDCSSFVYYSMLRSGYTAEQLGGTYPFTTSSMVSILQDNGYTRHPFVSSGELQPGDILWRSGHTEIYIGNGKNAGAHSNYDGRPGDSSGEEVDIGNCGTSWTLYFRKE